MNPMPDEPDDTALLSRVTPQMLRKMIEVMQAVYAGGQLFAKPSFEDRKALRAKSYAVLKALGLEK